MRLAIALAIVILLSVVLIVSTYHVFSQTADEPIHIAAGFEWLAIGRCNVDVEHPPLARILFGLDSFLTRANEEGDGPIAKGNSLLERNDRYVQNLARARAGNLLFFVIAVVITGLWAARLFGPAAGVLAAALVALLPNMLAHAGLATTDMSVTAMVVTALFVLTVGPAWLLGLVIGLGLVSKFSFLVFFVTGAIPFVKKRSLRETALIVAIAIVVVWSVYRFEVGTMRPLRAGVFVRNTAADVASRYAMAPGYEWVRPDLVERYWAYARRAGRNIDFVDWAKAAGYSSPSAGRHGNTMAGARPPTRPTGVLEPIRRAYQWIAVHVPLPAPSFLVGAEVVREHTTGLHPSFLLGQFRDNGWWYYFPVVFFFKTPIPFLALMLIGWVLLIRARSPVAFAPMLMLLPAMASSLDIGVRHILPLMPLLAMITAYGAVQLWRWKSGRVAVVALLLWFLIVDVRTHPDYLAYFNEFAGDHPERIAADSNLDWGQDLLRLASVVRRMKIASLHVAYFGSADFQRHLPHAEKLAPGEHVDGWVAVSEMTFTYGTADQRAAYAWLNALTPVRRVGHSIRLYFIPPHR